MVNDKVKNIIKGSLEIIGGAAKELEEMVGPEALLKKALGQTAASGNEMGQYLQKSGPDLSPEEIQKMTEEEAQKKEKEIAEARKKLRQVIPAHMRLSPKQQELRPYEAVVQEKEREKAMQVEAQRKQSQQMQMPTARPQRGTSGGRRKQVNKGFEGLQKDAKVG